MNTQASEQEDLQQPTTSREERFFGVTHEVKLDDVKTDDDNAVEIETAEDEESGAPSKKAASDKSDETKEKDEHKDEVDQYSERVQERINKLTWEREEAKRKLQAVQAERDEAFNATQSLYGQNQQYRHIIQQGEGHLIARMKQAADAAVATAEAKYRKAYEDGDTDAVIAAQKEMIAAQGQVNEAVNAENDYKFRQNQQQRQVPQQHQPHPQQQQQQQQHPQPPALNPEVQKWAEKNPWFMNNQHRDMTAVALSEHERLVRDENLVPNTEEYYRKIDAKMRTIFPGYFKEQGGEPSNTAAVDTVVASAERSTPGKAPRKVKLTPSALKLAKRLGLTPEQYANQVLRDRGII